MEGGAVRPVVVFLHSPTSPRLWHLGLLERFRVGAAHEPSSRAVREGSHHSACQAARHPGSQAAWAAQAARAMTTDYSHGREREREHSGCGAGSGADKEATPSVQRRERGRGNLQQQQPAACMQFTVAAVVQARVSSIHSPLSTIPLYTTPSLSPPFSLSLPLFLSLLHTSHLSLSLSFSLSFSLFSSH